MDATQLKQRRKALGLSQIELGKRVGLSGDFISRMERGDAPIGERTALAVTALRHDVQSAGVKPRLTDPMERLVEQALIDAGIRYATDQDGGTETALDFHLPDFDVSIEVKRFYTARTGEQMARAPNVIAVQGERAVRFLAAAIRSGDFVKFVLDEAQERARKEHHAKTRRVP